MSADPDAGEALADRVRAAAEAATPLRIVGGGTKAWYGRSVAGEPLHIGGHRGVVDYQPSELVITARAGTPLAEIEAILAEHGQWLAFEPLLTGAGATLGGAIAAGLAGPARPFTGAARDYLLGVTILDGRGRRLRFGGTVFKNVAGFDLFRPMCGALGTLGVLLDVSIRLAPKPAATLFRAVEVDWRRASTLLTGLLRRPSPITGAAHDGARLHLRLAGAETAVARLAGELGGDDDEPAIWDRLRELTPPPLTAPRLWRIATPRLAEDLPFAGEWLIDWAGAQRWYAGEAAAPAVRAAAAAAGGHATLFRGARADEDVFTPLAPALMSLHRRLKAALDPAGILEPGRLYAGL